MTQRRRVLAWLSLAAAPSVVSAPTPAALPPRLKAVTIGVEPYGVRGADGGAGGLFSELIDALAARSGITIDNTVVPYPRAMAMMNSGAADLLISLANSKLTPIARPLALVMEGEAVVVGRAGTHWAVLADLHGKVVAHVRGVEYAAALEADSEIRKYETTSIEQTLRMLLESRVDAAVGSLESMFYTLRTMGLSRDLIGAGLPIGRLEIRLFMSYRIKDEAVARTLARAMDALRNAGAVADLRRRYFSGLPHR